MSDQLALVMEPEAEAPPPPVVAEPEQVTTERRCGGRFDWHGRPLRCDQKTRHSGWHTARPRRGALVKWNDAGSYESVEPTVGMAKGVRHG